VIAKSAPDGYTLGIATCRRMPSIRRRTQERRNPLDRFHTDHQPCPAVPNVIEIHPSVR
jgi:hypothetical protein